MRKKEKKREKGNTPIFRPTPTHRPTQEITPRKKNHSSRHHPIKHLYSLKPYIQKKNL